MQENEVVRYFNRDLSWLKFNERVLAQAADRRVPLLERLRFLAIYSSNSDEFFMKRVGFLKRAVTSGVNTVGAEASSPSKVLAEIRNQVLAQQALREKCFKEELEPELCAHGVMFLPWSELTEKEKLAARDYFQKKVFPLLTPLAVDPAHPFPFLSNLSTSLGVRLHHPKNELVKFARIKIPDMIPQWLRFQSGEDGSGIKLLGLRDLVTHNLEELFPDMVIEGVTPFRVARSADIKANADDIEDMMDLVEEELRMRRVARVVRLEHHRGAEPQVLAMLKSELNLEDQDLYETTGELSYQCFNEIAGLDLPEIKFRTHIPQIPLGFSKEGKDVFQNLRAGDLLVHHPYQSFGSTVEQFIKTAIDDPQVLAIKVTLYRAGENSPLIPFLIRAAEKGKQVVAVIELKARFDEARNIYWGELLESAGVHVVYGMVGKKVHTKLALVIRQEGEDYNFYAHVGTGNYNPNTAKLYTDVGLLTSNREICGEMVEVFNYLTGLSLKKKYEHFLVAPLNMRKKFLNHIRQEGKNAEAGLPARIVAKMNSLEDTEICDALYLASEKGVKIDLIVRGFCTLRPGQKGLSENIQVRSIIGRFLEHSRIFYFQNGSPDDWGGRFLIGSADWMHRNLNNRVETVVPVNDVQAKKHLARILKACIRDTVQSWRLLDSGEYEAPPLELDGEPLSLSDGIHSVLIEKYLKDAKKAVKK